MNPVGFRTGPSAEPLPPTLDVMPNWHMWVSVLVTSSRAMSFSMQLKPQLVAKYGCSWRKYLLLSIWYWYTLVQNSTYIFACSILS